MPNLPPLHKPSGNVSQQAVRADHDAKRRRTEPWRKWYKLAIWRRIRIAVLEQEPLCVRCLKAGRRVASTVANHAVPHRGDWDAFVNGPFEALCATCHSSDVQSEERRAGHYGR